MTALLVSTGVTVFALLAGAGTFGSVSAAGDQVEGGDQQMASAAVSDRGARHRDAKEPVAAKPRSVSRLTGTGLSATPTRDANDPDGSKARVPVPDESGSGRRVVFDMSEQRVWLVGTGDDVQRSYLVSGSVTQNLKPGSYRVYSRSRHAVGVDDSGTMEYFVRFTRGQNAAIGFHDIPVDDGHLVQTTAQLGTPQSHGCIRQARPDAIELWDFAPLGTPVSVVA